MKTRLFLTAVLLLSVLFVTGQTNPPPSANENEIQMRVFGLGLKTFNLVNDLNLNTEVLPGNRIIATINPTKHFRIQPEYGLAKTSSYNENVSQDLTDKNTIFGLGVYGMGQKGRTNIYGGLKYLHSVISTEDVVSHMNQYPPYNTTFTVEETGAKANTWGIVIGGEYFFGNHFSVGVETGYQSTTAKPDDSTTDNETTSSATETNLLIRFYF